MLEFLGGILATYLFLKIGSRVIDSVDSGDSGDFWGLFGL